MYNSYKFGNDTMANKKQTHKKDTAGEYLQKIRDAVHKIKPVDINITKEYEDRRTREIDNIKKSSQVSDDYMRTTFSASRHSN
jgi:hypothetical protein